MPQTASPDSPAGRVLSEHRALSSLLAEIEKASGEAADLAAEALVSRLDALRSQLAAHFDGEEQSGLFDQIRELAPEQAHECAKLCDEHLDLLREVDQLRSAEARAADTGTWREGVRSLLARLAEHESKENELLTRVLDGSMEAQD